MQSPRPVRNLTVVLRDAEKYLLCLDRFGLKRKTQQSNPSHIILCSDLYDQLDDLIVRHSLNFRCLTL